MSKKMPDEIRKDLDRARLLHDRAASDYAKCAEFNQLMAEVLDKMEDNGHYKDANRVMSLLLECQPKEGARCDNATLVGEKIKKF
jgi:hypothetical protein